MKRRAWLIWAFIGCMAPMTILHAQNDRILPTPPTSSKSEAVRAEPGSTSSLASDSTGLSLPGDTVVSDEYVPSFSERMAGFRDVLFRPVSFSWFTDWAGADREMLSGDIEDPYWFKMEFMTGWFNRAHTPPMLTTGTPQESRGILGNEGTTVLFGGDFDLKAHFGFRVAGGFWMDPSQSLGFEGGFFKLYARTVSNFFASRGDPLLAAPYFDVVNNLESSFPIANEALNDNSLPMQTGTAELGMTSRIQGAEFNVLHNLVRGTRGRVDWSWGYRYLRYDDILFNSVLQSQEPPQGQNFGTQKRLYDEFSTENEFQGLNLGLRSRWWWGCWSFDVNGKIALGVTRNTVQVYGETLTASPPNFQIFHSKGGIYALASNIGDETFLRFGIVPEIELGVGYEWSDHIRLSLSYNFLVMTDVMRAGDQVDRRINPNILEGFSGNPALPQRLNQTSTLYMQALTFGIEFRY